jgi:trimeric autotransporter adhesin
MPVAAPIINSNGGLDTASITLAEGITAVTTVQATDADGDVVTYRIVGGKDAFRFQIDSVTGALSFKAAPDFEAPTDNNLDAAGAVNGLNTYEVIVEANDSKAGLPVQSDRQTITVTITDVVGVTLNGTPGDDVIGGLRPPRLTVTR